MYLSNLGRRGNGSPEPGTRSIRLNSTDVSEQHIVSIFRVEGLPPAFTLISFSAYSNPKMEAIYSPKRRLTFNGLHGVISYRCENLKSYKGKAVPVRN
jgi:hypothetical protein